MKLKALSFLSSVIILLAAASCNGDPEAKGDSDKKETEEKKGISSGGNASVLKVGDKLFNVPSPLETAFLIEQTNGTFNETILSDAVDANNFSTNHEKALNLGILGADLGYALIHDQSQQAFTLLANCKKLGTQLGISPALYAGLVNRFEGNLDNKDSLLVIISELNRLSDEYLKENQSEDVSALILAGGWVESLHFATRLYEATKDKKLRKRIAEQKKTIDNLIGLLEQQTTESEEMDTLLARLKDIRKSYDTVKTSYTYVEPETRPEKKLTVIKSTTTVEMSDETLAEIASKIQELRNDITGKSQA